MYAHITSSDDQRLFYYNELQQKDNTIKEHFNELQLKLQELDILHQSSIDLSRTTTPQSSRDSGIPIPSSCCSSPSNTQKPTFEFFLHPHSESTLPMSHIYDSASRYRPHVHWADESVPPYQEQNQFANIKKRGQRISLNATLPFYSKLNIRINANRINNNDSNENDQVRATATIRRLDPQYEHEHVESLRQAYFQHYSTLSPNYNIRINSPIQYDTLPRHRQISLPISLPIDKRLFLYIRNGEVFARC